MFFPGSPLNYPTNSLSSIRRYEATRNPTTSDIKNFNLGDEWLNTSNDQWFKLVSKANNLANWCFLCSDTFPVEEFLPDSGTSPVVANGSGQVTMTGTSGIEVIGGLNTLTFDLGIDFVADFLPDSGTSPVVPNVSNEVTMTGTNGIEVIGGLNTLTFDFTGSPIAIGFLPDSGTSPVIPDGAGEVTFTGGNGTTTVGSLNTITWDLTGTFDGDWTFTCPANGSTWMWDCTEMCTNFRGIDTGFTDTDWITCQSGLQTLDAVATAISTISLFDLRVTTVRATFSGARSDHSAALSGDIVYGARRSGGGAIEMSPPIVNIMDDGAASVNIDADVSGNDIRLLVTGEAATTWNWVVTYEYQTLNTNA